MILRTVIFLIINFAALGIGSWLMGEGPSSEWYQSLSKAPWTPPGWVFGAAWTSIMVLFAIYMAFAWEKIENRNQLIGLYIVQWILNVAWNPAFFNFHKVTVGLVLISTLTLLMGYFVFGYLKTLQWKVLFVAPYFIWLLIATSLNGYVLFNN